MENTVIILRQTVIMFLYMAIGFALFKSRLITREGSASMASLLLYAVVPAVIVQSFTSESAAGRVKELVLSLAVGAALLALAMAVSHLLLRKNPVNDFGAAFSNAGFIGFPLITALLGAEAVFYAAGFVAALNALQWTYGQYLMSGDKRDLSFKKVLKSPLVLALAVGLILFFTGLKLPYVVRTTLSGMASLNAPLAMVTLGVYLAQMDVKKTLGNRQIYLASAVRLLLIPALSILLMKLIPGLPSDMTGALIIAAIAPVGSNVAVYAQKQGADYPYAVGLVCLSTVLSIVTMPLMVLLAGAL